MVLRLAWECKIWTVCSYDPFLPQWLSKFDVAVEPRPYPPLPHQVVVVTTGAGPQGVISGPQLVDPWPGGPRTNLVIVLSPLLSTAPHPSLFLDPGSRINDYLDWPQHLYPNCRPN